MILASRLECEPSALTGIKPSLATTSADNRSNASVKPAPNKTFLTALSSAPLGYLRVSNALRCQQVNSANDSTRESEKPRLLVSPARASINSVRRFLAQTDPTSAPAFLMDADSLRRFTQ